MSDLISRQAAIDALEMVGYDFSESDLSEPELVEVCEAVGDTRQDMIDRIKRLPSAQSERKPGRWIKLDMHRGMEQYKCSECDTECYVPTCMGDPMYKFCPECGMPMEVEHE